MRSSSARCAVELYQTALELVCGVLEVRGGGLVVIAGGFGEVRGARGVDDVVGTDDRVQPRRCQPHVEASRALAHHRPQSIGACAEHGDHRFTSGDRGLEVGLLGLGGRQALIGRGGKCTVGVEASLRGGGVIHVRRVRVGFGSRRHQGSGREGQQRRDRRGHEQSSDR